MPLAQEASGSGGAAILLILGSIAMYFVPLIVGAIPRTAITRATRIQPMKQLNISTPACAKRAA